MATLTFSTTKIYNRYSSRNYFLFNWTHLQESNTAPFTVNIPSSVKLRMKVTGSFGTDGNVKLQGSMDGLTWFDLKDMNDTVIGVVAEGDVAVQQDAVYCYIRPLVSAGTTVDVTVQILAIP